MADNRDRTDLEHLVDQQERGEEGLPPTDEGERRGFADEVHLGEGKLINN